MESDELGAQTDGSQVSTDSNGPTQAGSSAAPAAGGATPPSTAPAAGSTRPSRAGVGPVVGTEQQAVSEHREHSDQQQRRRQAQPAAPAAPETTVEQLKQLAELRERDAITTDEYDAAKTQLLRS